jgi:hypothetical protein
MDRGEARRGPLPARAAACRGNEQSELVATGAAQVSFQSRLRSRSEAYHPLNSEGEQRMKEGLAGHGAVEIGRLREQIVGLADADRVRPEDGAALLAALDTVRLALAAGHMAAARAGMEQFITEAQGLMAAGVLAAEGDPPLAAARALLATLRG